MALAETEADVVSLRDCWTKGEVGMDTGWDREAAVYGSVSCGDTEEDGWLSVWSHVRAGLSPRRESSVAVTLSEKSGGCPPADLPNRKEPEVGGLCQRCRKDKRGGGGYS